MPRRAPEFRAADCAAFDAMSSARPRKPPPFAFAPRKLSAASVEARKDAARGRSPGAPREQDDTEAEHGDGSHIVQI